MSALTIIHYLPISYYPPTMNLVDMIENTVDIQIVSTRPDKGKLIYAPKRVKLYTPVVCKDVDSSIVRLLKYFWFSLFSLIKLLYKKPNTVMYYESISAFPVYIYKRYINKNANVYIHYHEYSTEDEYNAPGRKLFAMNHRIERKWLYTHSHWISHTNNKRIELFLEDCPMVDRKCVHVLPNYPPKSWRCKSKRHDGDVCKCVYVGSLSMNDTFVMEFCEWVERQKGRVTFDMFSFNFHKGTMDAVNALNCPYIHFHKEGIAYKEIPNLLDGYDVGILLYKANSINFQWNETNKFYEYLICGLDVWYPKEMLLLHELDKSQFGPQVKEMDFINIDAFDGTVKQGAVDNSSYHWFADDVYVDFVTNFWGA